MVWDSYYANVTTPQEKCAGTIIGQELYKLVLLDLILAPLALCLFYIGPYLWLVVFGFWLFSLCLHCVVRMGPKEFTHFCIF